MDKKIKVGITQGDYNGIGLEVALKAIADPMVTELFTPVLFADSRLVEDALEASDLTLPTAFIVKDASEVRPGHVNIVDLKLDDITLTPGKGSEASGRGAVASLEAAVEAVKNGLVDVLVTAPISKEAVQSKSFKFSGHTEFLGQKAGNDAKPQMILFDDRMRVALVTTHLPLAGIPEAVTTEKVSEAIRSLSHTLKRDFSVTRPKIAVLSLNPHVGDGGLLGSEESEIITPAIDACEAEGILAFGPYAADGFFGSGAFRNFDGILAMYHDQGLAPFKALAGEEGVNFTAGLPFVRTSPAHGTAFDIAWKNEANPRSMSEAIYKAVDIRRHRMNYDRAAANPLKKHSTERPSKADKEQ